MIRASYLSRLVALSAIIPVFALSTGCAAIFRGTTEHVTIATQPGGGSVLYQGNRVDHGESVVVKKKLETPTVQVGNSGAMTAMPMQYSPDPWLLGDAAFLLLGIIPGVIALGIDIGTGAWRNLDDRQVVVSPSAPEPKLTRAQPEDEIHDPFAQPIQP